MANGRDPHDDEVGDGSNERREPIPPTRPPARSQPLDPDEDGDGSASARRTETDASDHPADTEATAGAAEGERGTDSDSGLRQTLDFGGKTVAVGLTWRQVIDVTEAQELAKRTAADVGGDLWTFVSDGDPYIGVGFKEQGHRSGMPALAAELAIFYHGDWTGLFEIDEAYYVVSVSGGLIHRDSDIAFEKLEDALPVFEDFANRGSRSKRYVTKGLEDKTSITGLEVVDPVESIGRDFETRLSPISRTGAILKVALPAVIAVAAIAGVAMFAPSVVTEVKRKLGLLPEQKKQQVVIPPAPWAGQPKANLMLAACVDALLAVPRDAANWTATALTCNGRVVQAKYERRGNVNELAPPVGWLERWAKAQKEIRTKSGAILGKPVLGDLAIARMNEGLVSWKMPNVPLANRWRDSTKVPASLESEARLLWTATEDKFIKIGFTPVSDQPYFQTRSARANIGFQESQKFATVLAKPGYYLSSVTLHPVTLDVTVEIRMGAAKPFPTGDDIEIVRNPTIASTEGANLPPPPR